MCAFIAQRLLEKDGICKSEPSRSESTCSPLGDTGMLRAGNSTLVAELIEKAWNFLATTLVVGKASPRRPGFHLSPVASNSSPLLKGRVDSLPPMDSPAIQCFLTFGRQGVEGKEMNP